MTIKIRQWARGNISAKYKNPKRSLDPSIYLLPAPDTDKLTDKISLGPLLADRVLEPLTLADPLC